MVNVFAVPVFFIVFRETLETSIIVSVLLSFLKQQLGQQDKTVYNKLRKQVRGLGDSTQVISLTSSRFGSARSSASRYVLSSAVD